MHILPLLSLLAPAAAEYLDWRTHTVHGVNLGGWLCQESTIDSTWWAANSLGAPDEWGLCANQGPACSSILERRYASFITTRDIDTLHAAGINTLRIPTTYAAWAKVPGSQLYSGNQLSFLRSLSSYAIARHGMHVIIDVHSLPGGVNGMPFGEAEGHYGWFHNDTALAYSLEVIDAVIDFVQTSEHPDGYSIAPINEPVDNTDMTAFGTPAALSDDGAAWTLQYLRAVIDKVEKVNRQIPVVVQGSFRPVSFWSGHFANTTNLVFDVHNYYFAGRRATGENITEYICEDAVASAGDGRFPTFVGEWSIEAEKGNTLAGRRRTLNTGLYAFGEHTRGSAYWTARFSGNATVDGEGRQRDYWNYMAYVQGDMIHPEEGRGVC
ncbi:putative cellulase [Aspergillus steynii IBT 23096]|uniref:glucan 1,3-beta-glucosidase n=1 Tax=Aspergillus steynii IBT 23096 TaxID=1392250 RepID=A0A2I2GEJ8_9EURO|nr:putative cellulase [Aspergillus steynii IBT 23096]PLB51282.1 putative cellulase [Aspergillus steynii IBT 23096]